MPGLGDGQAVAGRGACCWRGAPGCALANEPGAGRSGKKAPSRSQHLGVGRLGTVPARRLQATAAVRSGSACPLRIPRNPCCCQAKTQPSRDMAGLGAGLAGSSGMAAGHAPGREQQPRGRSRRLHVALPDATLLDFVRRKIEAGAPGDGRPGWRNSSARLTWFDQGRLPRSRDECGATGGLSPSRLAGCATCRGCAV